MRIASILQGVCLTSTVPRREVITTATKKGGDKQPWLYNGGTEAQGREVTCPRSLNNRMAKARTTHQVLFLLPQARSVKTPLSLPREASRMASQIITPDPITYILKQRL